MNALARLAAAAAFLLATHLAAAPFAYVPLTGDNFLKVIDLATNQVVATVATGNQPVGVAVTPAGDRVYVSNFGSSTVEVFDTATYQRIASIPVDPGPFGIVMHPDGTKVYVAESGHELWGQTITAIDTRTHQKIATLGVGRTPYDLLMDPTGRYLYAGLWLEGTIAIIDTVTFRKIDAVPVGATPGPMAITPDGTRLFSGDRQPQGVGNTVDLVDLVGRRQIDNIFVGNNPFGLAIDRRGRFVYVAAAGSNSISVIDVALQREVATVQVGRGPVGLALSEDDTRLYVVNNLSGTMSIVDTTTLRVLQEVPVGNNPIAVGKFIGPATPPAWPTREPGPYTGLWWNPAEPGWGIHLTQRRNTVFAAWFGYSTFGTPRWVTASSCMLLTLPCVDCPQAAACSGALYAVRGPAFFGTAFDPSRVTAQAAGALAITFRDHDNAVATFEFEGVTRTVNITRQVFATGSQPAQVDYTDLWWNPQESGWGLAVTQQFSMMFLAWFVYDAGGNPTWYVVSGCAMNAARNSCTGEVYRTAGPPYSGGFDPSRVSATAVGTATLSFSGTDNGVLSYTVEGVTATKAVTRQRF